MILILLVGEFHNFGGSHQMYCNKCLYASLTGTLYLLSGSWVSYIIDIFHIGLQPVA